jgi:hypothetical protein
MSEPVSVRIFDSQFLISDAAGEPLVAETSAESSLLVFSEDTVEFLIVGCASEDGEASVSGAYSEVEVPVEPEWEEVVEASVRCASGLVVTDLDGTPELELVGRGGTFRLRASYRSAGGASESAAGAEQFLFQLWPAPMTPPRVLRSPPPAPPQAPVTVHAAAAGAAASARIGRDIDQAPGARALSGATGTARAEYTFPALARALFRSLYYLDGWFTRRSAGYGQSGFRMGAGDDQHDPGSDWYDPFLGLGAEIFCERIEVTRPRRLTLSWVWASTAGEPDPAIPSTTVTFALTDATRADQGPATTVTVEHHGLPVEWVDDMASLWTWKLERGDKNFELGRD